MTTRSILTIDPGGVARERGADGEGIVVATLGTGIDGRHPHFARHANLVLPPPLHHYDLTLLRNRRDDLWASFTLEGEPTDDTFTMLGKLDGELHDKEALFDPNGHSTHAAAIIA